SAPGCAPTRRYPILDALFTLSGGQGLTPVQRRQAFANRARFLRRSRLGYVVIDTARASEHLRAFPIRLLGLVRGDTDGAYELYVPELSLAPNESALAD